LQKVGTGANGWELNKCYRQTDDITLSDHWTPIGSLSSYFIGMYDGGGYSINNLNIPSSSNFAQRGLFGYIGAGSTVSNIALINVNINISTRDDVVGGIAGYNRGTIENCYVTGIIIGARNVGGVAGSASIGVIKNCYTTCDVTGSGPRVGGIVGLNECTITHCYATGKISGTTIVGGIVGENRLSTVIIDRCVALNPEVSTSDGALVGRISSSSLGQFSNNYARDSGMKLTANDEIVTPASNHAGKHGQNITALYYNNRESHTWWKNTLGFSDTFWNFAQNRLPHLLTNESKAFKETQNPVVH